MGANHIQTIADIQVRVKVEDQQLHIRKWSCVGGEQGLQYSVSIINTPRETKQFHIVKQKIVCVCVRNGRRGRINTLLKY